MPAVRWSDLIWTAIPHAIVLMMVQQSKLPVTAAIPHIRTIGEVCIMSSDKVLVILRIRLGKSHELRWRRVHYLLFEVFVVCYLKEWARNGSFMKKPATGWLHDDTALSRGDGVYYPVQVSRFCYRISQRFM